MGDTALFTIVAKNYLPQARVLMRSAAEHHPDWRRFAILVDQVDGYFDPAAEDFECILSTDLPIPEIRWFHFKYSILELSTAVKPYAFEYLFRLHGFDRIVYLDPDIRIYSPLHRISEALSSANIVLTPHLNSPLDDGKRPGEIDILRSGAYNLGFIAIAQSVVSASFLAWWQQRLYDHCIVDLARGLFVDQRWIDLVPGMFEGVAILHDPGYNVAYWNLSHRVVSGSSGGYEILGFRLAFFHFSGYDPDQPDKLSRHQNRHDIKDLPSSTQHILQSYCGELFAAGYATCRKWPYAFSSFQNGTYIPDMCRPIHHEAPERVTSIEDPFSDEGFKMFVDIWNSPAQESSDRPGISRLAYRIYRTRADVQAAMPDIFGGNYKRFLEWMLQSGRVEHGLGDAFLTTMSAAARAYKDHREKLAWPVFSGRDVLNNELTGGPNTGLQLRLTRLAAAIYHARPELQCFFPDPCGQDRERFLVWLLTYGKKEHHLSSHHLAPLKEQWRSVIRSLPGPFTRLRYEVILLGMSASVFLRGAIERFLLSTEKVRTAITRHIQNRWGLARSGRSESLSPEFIEPLEFGVNLVGYFRSETGVGQSVRSACAALRTASVPISLRSAGETSSCRTLDTSVGPMSSEFPYSTNLMHVNADQTSKVMRSLGEQFRRNRHNIGYWAWELEQFPDRWGCAFTAYQEVWTPSNFCRDALGRKATVPVFTVPHAISPIVSSGMDRQHFGLQPHSFIFLYAFDVLSVVERKNPLATIRAFEKAFGENPNCQLVIKVNNAATAPKNFAKSLEPLRLACASANIRILDATFSRGEMYALTQCADCIVSLHRSEGFGLFIAEAMYFGKPVIVTNYSGNTDFTREDNSMLVDYRLIPVGRGCHPYDEHCLWADPDIEQAADHMKIIAASADLRLRLSGAASEFVKTNLSPATVGQIMRLRLESLCKIEARQIAGAAKDAQCGSAA